MVVVRYAALAGLVVWLAALQTAIVVNAPSAAIWIQYACGAVIVVSLLAMKFVGPPPRGFIPRLALVVAMIGLAAYDHRSGPAMPAAVAAMAIGFILLFWYVRE